MQFEHLSPEQLATSLAAIVDASDDAIVGRDERGIINTWNKAATRTFGYFPEEIVGQSTLLLVPPDLHHEELASLRRVQGGERVGQYLAERLRKGGQRIEVYLEVFPLTDDRGGVIGSALVARDLNAQQRERAAQARLAAIVESSDDAIIAKDLSGVVTDWNAAAERIFGYSAQEMIGRSILTIIPPELQHEEPAILQRIRAGQRIEHYETQRLHKSGMRLDIALSISPIRDARGRVIGASKIARDISERLRSDKARLTLAAIVESSEDAIISKTLDGVITTWNASAQRLFGYTPEEIIGHSVLRLIPPELHHEEPQIIGKLRRGEPIEHFETRRRRKNGEVFDVSLTVSPIKDAKGRVTGASKIVRDISDRKAAESALIEKEKLAATGRLAATLAHEVNNPLESITNLAYLLAHNPSLNEEARKYADLLVREVQRAGDITRRTLSYHRSARVASDVNLIEVLEDVLRAKAKKLEARRIKLDQRFAALPALRGFPGELRQVFENLIENAIDAIGTEGQICVRARTRVHMGSQSLIVSFHDTGGGMSPFVLARIFEPFFTTKPHTGSGLGLWVARGIIRSHGGNIRARSSQSGYRHGTVFTITFPLEKQSINEPTAKSTRVHAA